MTRDPFAALYLPGIAVRPRREFVAELRERMRALLEGDEMLTAEAETERETRAPLTFALHYRNPTAALGWIQDVLGLSVDWAFPSAERVEHAGVRWSAGTVSVNAKRGMYEPLGPTAVLLAVGSDAELDQRYAQLVASGADIARPLGANWDRRSRTFVVRDPEGNLWELLGPTT